MNWEKREEIFSKEVLTNNDLAEMYSINPSTASLLRKQILNQLGLHDHEPMITTKGRLHILDYLKWLEIYSPELYGRYAKPEKYQRWLKRVVFVEEKGEHVEESGQQSSGVYSYNPLLNVSKAE